MRNDRRHIRYVSVFRGVTAPFFGSRKPQLVLPCVTTSPSTLPLRHIGLAGFSLLQRHSQNANLKEAVGIRILKQRNLRFYLKLTIHHHGASWGYLQLLLPHASPSELSDPPERKNRRHGQPVFLGIFWISKKYRRVIHTEKSEKL